MSLKATIHKAEIIINDMDRSYYQTHMLTVAQHPSETVERLMLRLVVFALHATEHLVFTRGLPATDEPDLWEKNAIDEIELWIELGEPDERRIRQSCGRAKQVYIYTYGRGTSVWWKGIQSKLTKLKNVKILHVGAETLSKIVKLHQFKMQLQATTQDNQLWLSCGEQCVLFEPEKLFPNLT